MSCVLLCTIKIFFSLLFKTFSADLSPVFYLNNTLFKANWRPKGNYFPLRQKIVCLPKDALSPGGEVPHHYTESTKITLRRELFIRLTCSNTHGHVLPFTQRHKHTHGSKDTSILVDILKGECLSFPGLKNTSGLCDEGPVKKIQEANITEKN